MKKYVLKSKIIEKKELPQHFYEDLNENQLKAVEFEQGPLLVIAGAGSGKTKTLVYRVARLVHEGVPSESILLLTFTRKASQEMLRRATEVLDNRCQRVAGGTFHSFANMILRKYAQEIGYPDNFTILDRGDAEDLLASIRKEYGLKAKEKRFPRKRTIAGILSKSINTEKSIDVVVSEEYPHYSEFEKEIAEICTKYQAQKKNLFVMDYDDLLIKLLELLSKKPEIQKKISKSFKYILVDEYQDTNRIQAGILKYLSGETKNVMVVGDDSQSIYSFRGANFKNIINFPTIFPDATIITLEENYRSQQPILDLTNALIARAREKYTKNLFTQNKGVEKPIYIETGSDNEQSRFIVQKVLELREEGVALDKIAVLFRSSSLSNDLEVELRAANIPYVKYGGFKFTETAHVKDVTAFLKIIFNVSDGVSWQRVLLLLEGLGPKMSGDIFELVQNNRNKPEVILDQFQKKKFYFDLSSLFKLVLSTSKKDSPSHLLEKIIEYYTPLMKLKYDDYHKRTTDLESLQIISERYSDLETLLTEISLEPPDGTQEGSYVQSNDDEKLILSTIHSAKGLEWHSVFVISLIDGYLPSFRSLGDLNQIEEERRLLYVAMTRAKKNLFLLKPHLEESYQSYYSHHGFQFSQPTRFLAEGDLIDMYTEKWALTEDAEESVPDENYKEKYPAASNRSANNFSTKKYNL